jgi:hypothetical protein
VKNNAGHNFLSNKTYDVPKNKFPPPPPFAAPL